MTPFLFTMTILFGILLTVLAVFAFTVPGDLSPIPGLNPFVACGVLKPDFSGWKFDFSGFSGIVSMLLNNGLGFVPGLLT